MAVADLGVRINLLDSASVGFNSLTGTLGMFGSSIVSARNLLKGLNEVQIESGSVALGTGLLFSGYADALKYTTDVGAELQDAMMRVSIAVDGADQNADAMKNTVINLADYSVFSLSQVADSFVALGEKGQNAAAIMDGVGESAIQLAEAVNSDAVPAADLLASSLQIFGGKAKDAKQYADLLTFAFYNGIPSVSGLQQAINAAGGQASAMGVKFNEFVLVLDLLGEAGLKGSQAGTSLRYMLASLADPTSKAQKELADMGILVINQTAPALQQLEVRLRSSGKAGYEVASQFDGTLGSLSKMFTEAQKLGLLHTDETLFQWAIKTGVLSDKLYDASGNFKGVQEAILQIGQAIDKLPPEQKMAALQQLFNVRAGQGATQLLKDLENVEAKIKHLQDRERDTSAAKDAAKVTSTFSGTVKELGTTFQSAAEKIGQANLGPLAGVGQSLNNLLHTFVAAPNSVHVAVATFIVVGTVLSGLAFIIATTTFVLSTVGPVLGTIGLAAAPTVAGILLLAIGAALLVTHWKQLTDFMEQHTLIFGLIAGIIGGIVVGILVGLVPAAIAAVASFAAMAASAIAAAIPMVIAFAPFILIGAVVGLVIAGIILAVRNWGHISAWLQQQWHNVLTWLGNAWHAVQTAITGVLTGIGARVLLWINAIKTVITAGFHHVQNIIHNAIQFVVGLFHWLYNHNYYFHDLVEGIKIVIKHVHDWLIMTWTGIVNWLKNAWKTIQNDVKVAWDWIHQHIVAPIQLGVRLVQESIEWVKNWLNAQWSAIVVRVHAAWEQFTGIISNAVGNIKKNINDIVNSIMGPINDLGGKMYNSGNNFIQMLINGIKDMAGKVGEAAKDIAGQIFKFLGFHSPTQEGPLSDSDTYMPNMMKMYAGGILQHKHLVHGAMNDVASGMRVAAHVTASGVRAAAASAAGSDGHGGRTIQAVVDGKVMFELMMDHMTGELRQVGAGRLHR